jgi:phosphoribosylaminoimidazole-succinocarboxamide synthase
VTITSTEFNLLGQTSLLHGKVRDIYMIDDKYLALVATDRISAFDVILPEAIPFKGQVLNQTAAYFLEQTKDIAPNWLLAVPDPNVSLGLKCHPFKVEMVIRDCLVGAAWRAYQKGERTMCGASLPDGMKEYDRFVEPIITPSTKAEAGHDEDISAEEIIANGLATADEWAELERLTRALFARGQAMAEKQGLYLADTKYEFGKLDDKIYLIDEIHTPDSSRYFYKDSFETFVSGKAQSHPKHLSKEFVREWLMERGFSGQAGQTIPAMDKALVQSISDRYIELYETLTGQTFEKPPETEEPLKRIEKNLIYALRKI